MSILDKIDLKGQRRSKLSGKTFEQLREIIYRETGIYFQDNKRYLLESRVSRRLKALSIDTFEEYASSLQNGRRSREIGCLINAITINETSFFRHQSQFDVLVDHLVPALVKERGESATLRLWSAASSTGEEAYSLAILYVERLKPRFPKLRVEIVATDIDTNVLEEAKDGRYNAYATRNIPPAWLRKHFTPEGKHHRLNDDIRKMVRFKQVNLSDRTSMLRMRSFDIIFCANVLIYFDDESKKQVISSLYNSLATGGYLFVGFSESLYGVTQAFHAVRLDKTIAYQKV